MNMHCSVADPVRIAGLGRYNILDTPTETDFDDVARLAAAILDAPIAVVNLISGDRQWFKAEIGIGVRELPLDVSICAHAILQPDIMVVPDTTLDERFARNPLVAIDGGLRFYAGAPLTTPDGLPIGTVCVLDREPRPGGITEQQRLTLQVLARQVMAHLELRRAAFVEAEIVQQTLALERKSRFAMEAGRLGSWELDLATGVMTTSSICKMNFGRRPDDRFTYEDLRAAIHPDDRDRMDLAVKRTLDGVDDYDIDYRAIRPDGSQAWLNIRAQLDRDDAGRPVRMAGISIDITERMMAEEQKQLLMDELAHRVKNTFAVVQAIASQTLRRSDPALAQAFQDRLVALSHAHDILLRKDWSPATISSIMGGVLGLQADAGRFDIDGTEMTIGPKAALSLSLLMHEMATNALKYGSLSVEGGKVEVRWALQGDAFRLTWRETGGPAAMAPERRGFGSRLIGMGIGGSRAVELDYLPDGLSAKFEAPLALIGD